MSARWQPRRASILFRAGEPTFSPTTLVRLWFRDVMHVRLATGEDAAAIARIYNEGIADRLATFETRLRSEGEIAETLAQRATRYPTVMVVREDQVGAWAGTREYRPREA